MRMESPSPPGPGFSKAPHQNRRIPLRLIAMLSLLLLFSGGVVMSATIHWELRRGSQYMARGRTMDDLREMSLALEDYACDHDVYPETESAAWLCRLLEPTYMSKCPLHDGWGNELMVRNTTYSYLIWSNGRDGVQDAEWQQPEVDYLHDGDFQEPGFDRDIVLENGDFIQWPPGTLAGWSSVHWNVTAEGFDRDVPMGALILYLTRGDKRCFHYPPPQVDLVQDGEVIVSNQYPAPMRFQVPGGFYDVRITLKEGQVVERPGILVESERVTHLQLDVPHEYLNVSVIGPAYPYGSNSNPRIEVWKDGRLFVAQEGNPAYFTLLPGVYQVGVREAGLLLGERTVTVGGSYPDPKIVIELDKAPSAEAAGDPQPQR